MRKRRKNFLPTFLLAFLFWLLWGGLVYFSSPDNSLLIVGFFLLLFLAVFLTAALIFANSRLGLLAATFIVLSLLFRYFQVGNILNLTLLTGIFIALGFYLSK